MKFNVSSQAFDNLKNRDTLYIIFDVKSELEGLSLERINNPNNLVFRYKFPDAKVIDFGFRFQKDSKERICLKKDKLKNFKVAYNEDFLKTTYKSIISELQRKKITIFLVDSSESRKNKVFIREVRMLNYFPDEF